jgi:hypothetical protein
MIVKRLLTIAARDQWEAKVKGQEQIQELLTFVGAKPHGPTAASSSATASSTRKTTGTAPPAASGRPARWKRPTTAWAK